MDTTARHPTYWLPGRDQYGRSAHHLIHDGRAVGAVVRMPAAAVARFGGMTHLANDWSRSGDAAVSYHRTLAAAKAAIEAVALGTDDQQLDDAPPVASFGWPTETNAGRIWTARYRSPSIVTSGLAPVRITLGAPRFPLPYRLAADLRLLAPYGLFGVREPGAFRVAYRARLDRIGLAAIRARFDEVRGRAGTDPVLLCFEDVRSGRDWCHRLVFAEWWVEQTGEVVPELSDIGGPR